MDKNYIKPGQVLNGRYKIVSLIGSGGMAEVYLAYDLEEGTKAAVKQDHGGEGELLLQLDHPGIVWAYDSFSFDGQNYLVEEYVEGVDLRTWLKSAGKIEARNAMEIAFQLCDILSYLHSLDPPVIYRDLKPENVILQENGKVKLIDFGIARRYVLREDSDTSCFGTVGYAAPEQYDGSFAQSDCRTDLFGLGKVLAEMINGRREGAIPKMAGAEPKTAGVIPVLKGAIPKTAGVIPVLEGAISKTAGVEPNTAGADTETESADPVISEIIQKCTAPSPEERYESAEELAYAIRLWMEEQEKKEGQGDGCHSRKTGWGRKGRVSGKNGVGSRRGKSSAGTNRSGTGNAETNRSETGNAGTNCSRTGNAGKRYKKRIPANPVALTLTLFALLIYSTGFVFGIGSGYGAGDLFEEVGTFVESFSLIRAAVVWAVSFALGSVFMGLGQIVRLLHEIRYWITKKER